MHPEAAWPEPGTPLFVTLTARSHWPKPAYTRCWPLFKRVHPILATYPPVDYNTRLQSRYLPDYGRAIWPVAHTHPHAPAVKRTARELWGVLPPHAPHPHTCGGTFRPSCTRGIISGLFCSRPLRAPSARARAHAHRYTQQSPLSAHSTTMTDTPPVRVSVRVQRFTILSST